jgi:uncharacterized protein YcfJ
MGGITNLPREPFMQKTQLALAVASLLVAFAASASGQMYGDVARVVSATPISERVPVPRRECLMEPTGTGTVPGGYQRAANEPAPRAIPPGCETAPEMTERVVGYDVRYEYNGHEFSIRMPYDPGPQMAVNVEVRPPMPAPPRDPLARPRTPNYRGTY